MRRALAMFLAILLGGLVACGDDAETGPVFILKFATQPGNGRSTEVLGRQPAVIVVNRAGERIASSVPITLSISAGRGTPGATLLGTVTVEASFGVAQFTDIGVDLIGSNYTLRATSWQELTPGIGMGKRPWDFAWLWLR